MCECGGLRSAANSSLSPVDPTQPPTTATNTTNAATKYAPPNPDGLKPWVRESYHFGETHHSIEYAATAREARDMYRKMHLETVRVRRATNEDVAAYGR
jgi:hypothetical protein